MPRKLLLGTVLAGLLAVIGAPLAFAGDGHRRQDSGGTHVIRITLKNLVVTDLDLGAPGPSAGDRFTIFADAFRAGKQVGTAGYHCDTLFFTPGDDPQGPPADDTAQCFGSISLPGGQVTVQGLVDRTGPVPVTLAITGGTGTYRTAHGEIQTSGPNEQNEEPITLKIIR